MQNAHRRQRQRQRQKQREREIDLGRDEHFVITKGNSELEKA
jgi:hypothetical protein